jgi:hypothetical protein
MLGGKDCRMTRPPVPDGFRAYGALVSVEPPFLHQNFEAMLAVARHILASRQALFPIQISNRKIMQEDADAELATWAAMIAHLEWQRATTLGHDAGPPPISVQLRHDFCGVLDRSISRICADGLAREAVMISGPHNETASAIVALRWHYDHDRGAIDGNFTMHRIAWMNQELRQNINQERKAA